MEWEKLDAENQIKAYWEYCYSMDDDEEPISFSEFDEMMQGYIF